MAALIAEAAPTSAESDLARGDTCWVREWVDTAPQSVVGLVVGLFTYGARRLAQANRDLLGAREEVPAWR